MALPQQIPSADVSFGSSSPDGRIEIAHLWYLFLYNVSLQVQKIQNNELLLRQIAISTNQSLGVTDTLNLYVASVPLTLTIAESSTLAANWYNEINAFGGNVTVTPYATDKINGGVAGASFVVSKGTSAQLYTDASGNIFVVVSVPAALPADYFLPFVWTSGADLSLGIGQSATASFTNATSMPLHIACGDGQIYEMEIVGSYTAAAAAAHPYLQPNNAVPATNSFTSEYLQAYGTTVVGNNFLATADGGFLIGLGSSVQQGKYTFFTSTANKKSVVMGKTYETTNGNRATNLFGIWNDTTTVWSSLGTVIMPNAWTGVITVTRKA